jgi:predicted dehydrogenase
MSGPLRVLIVGAGDMARRHADAWRATDGVDIAAVASRGRDRAAALASDYAIPAVYDDWRGALDGGGYDIVSICIPTAFHPDVAVAAMESGCHVLTEKPIALDEAGARRMAQSAKENDRRLSVVFNRRFNGVWDELRRRIDDIGTPMVYNCQEIRSVRPKPAMHDRRLNGGPLLDCIVHDFDMLLTLFGAPVRLYSRGLALGAGKPQVEGIEDVATDTGPVIVEFEGGHIATILYAWGLPAGSSYWQYREFLGPRGVLRLMGEFGEEIRVHGFDGSIESAGPFVDDGHAVIAGKFAAAVRGEGPVPVTPEEALAALRMALAVGTSVENGTVMDLAPIGTGRKE